jgi:hypothetical protein
MLDGARKEMRRRLRLAAQSGIREPQTARYLETNGMERDLLENLTVPQLIKKFPPFHFSYASTTDSRCGSVRTVTGYGIEDLGLIPDRARFCLRHYVQTSCGTLPAFCPMDTAG